MHAVGQYLVEQFVRGQEVGDMCYIRFSCADSFEEVQHFVEGEMSMVRIELYAVHRHRPEPFEFLELAVFKKVHVGEIGNVAESVTEHGKLLDLMVPALYGNDHRGRNRR